MSQLFTVYGIRQYWRRALPCRLKLKLWNTGEHNAGLVFFLHVIAVWKILFWFLIRAISLDYEWFLINGCNTLFEHCNRWSSGLKDWTQDLSGYLLPRPHELLWMIETNNNLGGGLHVYGSCFSLLANAVLVFVLKLTKLGTDCCDTFCNICWLCGAWTRLVVIPSSWLVECRRDPTLTWYHLSL